MATTTLTREATDLEQVAIGLLASADPSLPVELAPVGGSVRPPATLPVARVLQSGDASFEPFGGGSIAGKVRLVVYSAEGQPYATGDLWDWMRAHAVLPDAVSEASRGPSARLPGGVLATPLLLNFKRAVPTVPTLLDARMSDRSARELADALAANVSKPSRSDPERGVTYGGGWTGQRAPGLTAQIEGVTVHAARPDSDGTGRHLVDVILAVRRNRSDVEADRPRQRVAGEAHAMRGRFIPNLGRIESAEVTGIEPVRSGQVITLRCTLRFRRPQVG
jgi:hypothetical protein